MIKARYAACQLKLFSLNGYMAIACLNNAETCKKEIGYKNVVVKECFL